MPRLRRYPQNAARRDPVRWVRLELSQGLDVPQPAALVALEFSEIIAHGRQEPVPMSGGLGGDWPGRGLDLALNQDGPVVVGCYDKGEGRLQGTVEGRLLRATGTALRTGVPSAFVVTQRDDGAMFVLRSTNGAPFRAFEAGRSGAGSTACVEPKPLILGSATCRTHPCWRMRGPVRGRSAALPRSSRRSAPTEGAACA